MDRRDPIEIDPRFGMLPEAEGRASRFATSAVINAVVFGLAILLAAAAVKHKQDEQAYISTQLVLPEEAPPPPKPKPLPRPKLPPPPPQPKIEQPKPPEIKPVVMPVEQPKPVVQPPAPPKAERIAPPPPKLANFTSAVVTKEANNNKAPTVKVGGFGDPVGVTPNPNANRPSNIASVGAFDMPKGAGVGAGGAPKGSVHGVAFGTGPSYGQPGGTGHGKVNMAGMSNGIEGGVPGGTGTGRGGAKSTGGFGTGIGAAGPAVPHEAGPVNSAPVVLYKPDAKAFYTADAKSARVEGDVVVKIRVDVNGHAEVLGIVRSLGHGLDEAAERIVQQTRFKPAMANGQPVEVVTNLHVTFELA